MREADTDYVIGTGMTHSINDFLDAALEAAKVDSVEFREKWLRIDSRLQRPGEIHTLCANPAKAYQKLHWKPTITFRGMVERMVRSEMAKLRLEVPCCG
jgi:GDPmannose 4,6-dehydratase